MAVRDEDLFVSVAADLIEYSLKHLELQPAADRNGTGFMLDFGDDTERIARKDHNFFKLRGACCDIAGDVDIRAERQVIAVLFEAANGENTDPFARNPPEIS